jgi:rubrerythrin
MASLSFNADEIFAVAEQIEINGSKFYNKVASFATHAPTKAMLLELAAMEDKHLRAFQTMRAQLTDKDRRAATFDPEGETAMYLKALADGRVFNVEDPASQITGREAIEDVLQTAIGMEKESIAFYVGIMEMVPQELGKFRVSDIVKEEMRHVTILMQHLQQHATA